MLAVMKRRRFACALLGAAGVCGLRQTQAAAGMGVTRRRLAFPADFGAHADTRIEWWYVTGALTSETPARSEFGFQITFFRSRSGVRDDHPSRFAASQVISAHAALTDLRAGRLRHEQRIARAGFGLAYADAADTRVGLGDWQLARNGPPAASVYRAGVVANGFAFDFRLDSTQPILLQGDAGWSRKGPDPAQASHYYSQPQLSVSGELRVARETLPVRGKAWLDHEWSDTPLDREAVGWDWIGFDLDDGSALTAFQLRRADGSALYAGGSFRSAGAPVRSFAPQEVRFMAGRVWTSPATSARYPVVWRVETPAGSFRVRSLLDNQELDSRMSTGTVYWEGLSDLLDAQGRHVGRGYLEMTGYAARMQASLSGSPAMKP